MGIELHNISKVYRKGKGVPVHAVKDLDLTIESGQIVGFLGPNGAGKTTTIKMICGLIEPTTGSIHINGINLSGHRSQAMRQIGAVLEGTRNIYWRLTAWQNLMYFGQLKGFRGKPLRQNAERLLKELDLWDRRNDQTREFSRGMQQKVAIACALIADPPIVLLDEPTLGLDVQAARTVKEWVKSLSRDQGRTVILTTHQLDMAQAVCDRVAIMRQGSLIADHDIQELLNIFREEYYEIRLEGHLQQTLPAFNGLQKIFENGHTRLIGPIDNTASLYTILDELKEANMPLMSVQRVEPDLEEVFVRITEEAHD